MGENHKEVIDPHARDSPYATLFLYGIKGNSRRVGVAEGIDKHKFDSQFVPHHDGEGAEECDEPEVSGAYVRV